MWQFLDYNVQLEEEKKHTQNWKRFLHPFNHYFIFHILFTYKLKNLVVHLMPQKIMEINEYRFFYFLFFFNYIPLKRSTIHCGLFVCHYHKNVKPKGKLGLPCERVKTNIYPLLFLELHNFLLAGEMLFFFFFW